jgi:hypothetical protein
MMGLAYAAHRLGKRFSLQAIALVQGEIVGAGLR